MSTMPSADFETAYETLATAIDFGGTGARGAVPDPAGAGLGHELGDIAVFQNAIRTALDGLE